MAKCGFHITAEILMESAGILFIKPLRRTLPKARASQVVQMPLQGFGLAGAILCFGATAAGVEHQVLRPSCV